MDGPGTVTSRPVANSHDSIIISRLSPKVLYCPWTSALFFFDLNSFALENFDTWLSYSFLVYFKFSRLPHIQLWMD